MLLDIGKGFRKLKIEDAKDVVKVLFSVRKGLQEFEYDKEYLYVIGLTRRNSIKYIDLVSIGTLVQTVASPREIFRMAIHKAVGGGIILAHNHPSGNILPSNSDIQLTNRIKQSGKILEIELLDHIIFSDEGNYYSFVNEGTL